MIIGPKNYTPGMTIDADICIIGGGPAAITLALTLRDQHRRIIMLTGGSWSETPQNRALNKGFTQPSNSHEPPEENRRRVFGGASAVWGGRCVPFDAIDFEERSWVPNSGWPISYAQLAPYYQKALELCEAGENNFDARNVFPDEKPEIIPGFDNDQIVSYPLERWSPPTRFAVRYKKELERSGNIDIYLDAHVTRMHTELRPDRISSVSVIILNSEIRVTAGQFVLAAGGIENPRLLLASKNKYHPTGIGNEHDNVGRFYMAHLMGTFGAIDPVERKKILFSFEVDKHGVYCRRRWWLTPKVQQEKKLANAILYLNQPVKVNAKKEPADLAVKMIKAFVRLVKGKSFRTIFQITISYRRQIFEHLVIIIKNSLSLFPFLFRLATRRLVTGKQPLRLPSVHSKWLYLYIQTEHTPNRESRICLSDVHDRLGIPLPVIRVAFNEIDIETVLAARRIFFQRFQNQKKGKIHPGESTPRNMVQETIRHFNSGAHHIGTTRMSDDPATGVVDANCKVHGISNLYIAGSSVFPTSSHANPTLTLVALAVKLADFLKTTERHAIEEPVAVSI